MAKAVKDERGEYYVTDDGKRALKVERVILPHHEGETLQEQDDIIVWQKFQILLQAVEELSHQEPGELVTPEKLEEIIEEYGTPAGDATRQLRVVTQEAVRRKMFSWSVVNRDPADEALWTWYEVLKQLVEGENNLRWEKVGDANHEYTVVVKALLERGHEMPRQETQVDPLLLDGKIIT